MVDWTALRSAHLPEPDSSPLPPNIELPIFPRVVTEFMRRVEDPNTEIREIAKIIETDTNLTCDLLRHVNSAAFARRSKANSAVQALTTLGLRRCKLFLLTAAAQSSVRGMKFGLLDANEFWASNIERGMFAREIALKMGLDADLAYTGAILQDFLLPLMTHHFRKDYSTFLRDRHTRSTDFTAFERSHVRCDHAMLGAICLLKWGFPDELVCSVLLHHMHEDELQKYGLMDTALFAVTASALLPDPMQQESTGTQRLLAREQLCETFDLFQVAETVDANWQDIPGFTGNRAPLLDRMEKHVSSVLQNSVGDSLHVDKNVGNYRIEEKLGEGAMGVVYRARHNMLQRPAAVKLIRPDKLNAKNAALFEKEVQATCKLEHPNTVSIYDYGHTPDGLFYYAMEYLDGITLKELVLNFGPQSEGRVLHILYQMCGAMAEAHAHGIVHRDIKPENVMLTAKGRMADLVKVLDFGLAKHLETDKKEVSQGLTGTPLYLSPEAIDTPEKVDHRSDIYSLGAVGYYILTGETVFTGNTLVDICLQQVMASPIRPTERLKKPVSPDIEQLIMRCLKKNPDERPQDLFLLCKEILECVEYRTWTGTDSLTWWQNYRLRNVDLTTNATVIVDDEMSATYVDHTANF